MHYSCVVIKQQYYILNLNILTNVVSSGMFEIEMTKERLVIYLGKNESAKLARLVNTAKGPDRSIREYARASQVNVSTISRTINGEYTPGIKVLQKLTSPEAEPRGGVTFQDLVDAANLDKTTTIGYTLGLLASGMLMGPMGALVQERWDWGFCIIPVM